MSTYCSMDVPDLDGSLYFDVAYDCFGRGVRITLDGKVCYPTSSEAREVAAALLAAAEFADDRKAEDA